jgi:hypothetical protein
MPSLAIDISVSITKMTIAQTIVYNTATVTSKISTNYSNFQYSCQSKIRNQHSDQSECSGTQLPENSECIVFGQAVFLASHSLVPANTACYTGYAASFYVYRSRVYTKRKNRMGEISKTYQMDNG